MSELTDLNPIYHHLPYMKRCEHKRMVWDDNLKQNVTVYEGPLLKTYPPFPWRPGTGDHSNEDPVAFIDRCADAGLVDWETESQRKAREERENTPW